MDIEQTFDIYEAKANVKSALSATSNWRQNAAEDYAFMQGKQWEDADLKKMREAGRPAITINRIRATVNLLCGYASQNETEPDFLPRSEEDDRISRVAKGITKYCLDRAHYQRNKGKCFRDKIICGLANYWVSYEFDYNKLDGAIKIERVSPFDVFIDPESTEENLSDAQFVGRYSWESTRKLKQVYPDKANEIDMLSHKYDDTELEAGAIETINGEALWYNEKYKKVRVVQYWYKEYGKKNVYMTKEGLIDENNPLFVVLLATGKKPTSIPDTKIRYATFSDSVLLEEGESPYKHGKFPLVREYCYYTGELIDDELEPAGVVRDLKDAQREKNKNRSQRMHVVNQQSLGVRFWQGQIDEHDKKIIEKKSTTPGANIFLKPGVTFQDGTPSMDSAINLTLEQQADNDFYSISGITPESLSGSIGSMSGKAIDLRQSVTTVQTADIFAQTKEAELQIVKLLWGEKNAPGLIPQFYNQEKAMRILGDDGKKEFVQIAPGLNQPMQEQILTDALGQPQTDAEGNPIKQVLYDLSCFDFDIVISTSQASATARKANLYQLLEAKKSGVDIPMDIILDFMDFPEKEAVKKRIQQAAEKPAMPELRVSGSLDDMPAEALSMYLQTLGVEISPQQIMAERLALKGRQQNIQNAPQILPPVNDLGGM
ncbi:portal protein [Veillonella parvula]|uniref:portal protein n=1 Tax=Veillonella parvula TaxID=29466 RepID=UPI0020618DCF|nr:MAG TPA: portal protein [Caudoviricetes sp.]